MRQTYRIIPVYTGDVSGVCSALYELGGMVVIHDPSGCNSTYNTHDETRWYDKESLIFISGLAERDAVLGNDEKFIRDVVNAAKELSPSFIALTNSPIPFMNGTDFSAIAKVIEKKTGIRTFYVPANGMHDYTFGAGKAFEKLLLLMAETEELPLKEKTATEIKVNILGMTPLDYDAGGSVDEIEELLEAHSFAINCNLGMGQYAVNWKKASAADVNLVVSASGFLLAKQMEEKWNIPYVVGCPIGPMAEEICKLLVSAVKEKNSKFSYMEEPVDKALLKTSDKGGKNQAVIFLGETVIMNSIASAIHHTYGVDTKVICPIEGWKELYADSNVLTEGEEDLEELLKVLAEGQESIIVCDPLYQPIIPEKMAMIALSHEGFSGRCFYKDRKNLIGENAEAYRYLVESLFNLEKENR